MDTLINIVLTVLFFGCIALLAWLIYTAICHFKSINNTSCEAPRVTTEAIISLPEMPILKIKVASCALGTDLIYIKDADGISYTTSHKNCLLIEKPAQED